MFPSLSLQEELYVKSIVDLSYATLGVEEGDGQGQGGRRGEMLEEPQQGNGNINLPPFLNLNNAINIDSRNLQVIRKLLTSNNNDNNEDNGIREEIQNILQILDSNSQKR